MKICRSLYMKSLLGTFIAIFFCHLALANIDNLKGTYSILKDDYKHLSVIHGAIAEQLDYVMHLYDYGCLGETKKVTSHDKDCIVPDPKNASDVIKLVHLFFHRPPDTTGRSDFVVIQVLRDDPNKIMLAKAFGFIIGFIGADGFNINIGNDRKENPRFIKNLQDLSGEPIKEIQQGGDRNHVDIFKRLAELDATEINKLLKPSANLSKNDKDYKTALTTFLPPILRSLQDDGTLPKDGITPTFVSGTTLNILQAIVFKLFGDDKNLLKEFYEKVNEVVKNLSGTQIFREDLPDYFDAKDNLLTLKKEWISQKFNPAQRAAYLDDAKKLGDASPDELVQNFETLAYVALMPGDYPRHEGMETAVYKYDEEDQTKTVSFSDCMDNTFRNMINVLVYERDTVSLKTFVLKERIERPDISFDEKLEAFYAKFSSATETGGTAHNCWANVISNIPGVAYNRHTNNPNDEARLTGCGYIRNVAKIDKAFLENKKYLVIDDDNDILYEIMPSLRNVIVVFNHFFGLNLFEEEKGDTANQKFANAFIRNDFVKVYFKKMCEKLKINIAADAWPKVNIDEIDYQQKPVNTFLIFNQNAGSFDFKLLTANMAHGELTPLTAGDSTKQAIDWIRNTIQNSELCKKIPNYIRNELFHIEYAIFHENWTADFKKFSDMYNLLYWLPIHNSDFIHDFIIEVTKSKLVFDLNCLKLLNFLIDKIPDANIKGSLIHKFSYLIVLNNEWNPELGLKGLPESKADDLISKAEIAIKSKDWSVRSSVIYLFKALVEKNQGFEQAINAAKIAIQSDTFYVKLSALELFRALFEKNQGFEQAIDAAEITIQSDNPMTRYSAIELFKVLVEKLKSMLSSKFAPPETESWCKKIVAVGSTIDPSAHKEQKDFKVLAEKFGEELPGLLQKHQELIGTEAVAAH